MSEEKATTVVVMVIPPFLKKCQIKIFGIKKNTPQVNFVHIAEVSSALGIVNRQSMKNPSLIQIGIFFINYTEE